MNKQSVLIINANIFNGTSDKLATGMSVLIEGNKISKIAKSIPASSGATLIDAKGCAMTPGLIDADAHLQWNLSPAEMFNASLDYLASLVLVEAKATLTRGSTSFRDISGQVLGAKRAIDEGHFIGPRIWSCCAGLGMTSGHADLNTKEGKIYKNLLQ